MATARTAVRAATKGCVVTAVRCDDGVRRLAEMGLTPRELEAAKIVVVRQRLMRALCLVEAAPTGCSPPNRCRPGRNDW